MDCGQLGSNMCALSRVPLQAYNRNLMKDIYSKTWLSHEPVTRSIRNICWLPMIFACHPDDNAIWLFIFFLFDQPRQNLQQASRTVAPGLDLFTISHGDPIFDRQACRVNCFVVGLVNFPGSSSALNILAGLSNNPYEELCESPWPRALWPSPSPSSIPEITVIQIIHNFIALIWILSNLWW